MAKLIKCVNGRRIGEKKMAEWDDCRAAIDRLHDILTPGQTIHTTLRHCSRSGMYRSISLFIVDKEDGDIFDITYLAARAIQRTIDKHGGIGVGGCGMDTGFALVYDLGGVLYPNGVGCIGEGCRSNDHSNGSRNYTQHGAFTGGKFQDNWHKDGGYTHPHAWL